MNKLAPERILITDNYNRFKKLKGNRDVPIDRINKIINSINNVGYIISPVIVNEKYEVIDGQGRVEALRQLGLPIYYILQAGIGLEECIAMNIHQTNWSMLDFVKSYAATGNASYQYLVELINEYKKYFNTGVIFYAANCGRRLDAGIIKNGDFRCSDEQFNNAVEVLDWLKKFKSIVDRIPGRIECFYNALIFCYLNNLADKTRLYEKISLYQDRLIPTSTIYGAMELIESIYNFRHKDKVYIATF